MVRQEAGQKGVTPMFNVVCMTHDIPSQKVHKFFNQRWEGGVSHLELMDKKEKWNRSSYYSCEIQKKLKPLKEITGIPLTVYGHGSFHHYTYGIVGNTMPQRTDEFLYIHIDYHTDAGVCKTKCNCGTAHGLYKCGMSVGCGSFVMEMKDHGAKNFSFIGTDANCGWKRSRRIRQEQLLQSDFMAIVADELRRKRCENVYVSMDLDVLEINEIPTGYGRGKIKLQHLLDILTVIKENKNIMAADILGLCKKDHGSHRTDGKAYYQSTGLLTYGIIAAHLSGRDYLDAVKVRDHIMHQDRNKKNGATFASIANGLKF